MIFKREKRRYPTVHWLMPELRGTRTFCGHKLRPTVAASTDKDKVNCLRCLACMRLHDHLPSKEDEDATQTTD